ncbi:MAG: dihydrofolate reductase family protein [Chloroflexota bacterium]
MAKLIYSAMMSLDGYIADETGNFDWAVPDREVHTFVNDLERQHGTYVYGRRMYEVMAFWEDEAAREAEPEYIQEFAALWREADKIVYSKSLPATKTARTRLEREFNADQVRRLKTEVVRDVCIGGPTLAAHAFKAGLVDECHFFVAPASVGADTAALARDFRLRLEPMDQRSFRNGMVHLHYLARPWE